jgi:rhodanese-related sulfurtransferase
MQVAVPANLKCGAPAFGPTFEPALEQDWAPLAYTFAGIWEIQPNVLEEYLDRVQVLDVREPAEFSGPLGHIAGAHLVPMASLVAQIPALSKEKPIIAVCRSGARSAQATVLLKNAGVTRVANLAGGMLRWRAQHLPVKGGTE